MDIEFHGTVVSLPTPPPVPDLDSSIPPKAAKAVKAPKTPKASKAANANKAKASERVP